MKNNNYSEAGSSTYSGSHDSGNPESETVLRKLGFAATTRVDTGDGDLLRGTQHYGEINGLM